ncbi:MAG TPA: hypothetical protein VKA00_08615 [Trueperaceae bacterium]|nr:hypothetical protein [Trueperaceae bacterium]
MRKSVLVILLAIAFVVGSVSFAATYTSTANHNIDVSIPEVAFLRIGNTGTSLTFAPTAEQLASGLAANSTYTMTGTSGQDVLQALVNKGSWSLGVSVSTTTSVTTWAATSTDGLALSQITVTPTVTGDTGIPALVSSFDLGTVSTSGTSIAAADGSGTYTGMTISSGSGTKTQGWQNVGIDAGSYTLTLTGNEAPGSYSAVVTYVLATP